MRRRKVLVVEDQQALARALETMLVKHGYTVKHAANGEEGVACAREWIPDAVLMDLSMPVMNGFDATALIRSDERTRWIPVMATTALDRPEEVLRALLCGFNKYLRKPYKEADLIEQLEELIAITERQRAMAALAPEVATEGQLIEVGQLLVELMRTLQERVACDLFAIGWQGQAGEGLLITLDAPEAPQELLDEIQQLVWGEEPPGAAPEPTVVLAEGATRRAEASLASGLVIPMQIGEVLGTFLVGRFDEASFTERDERVVADLAPLVAQLLQTGVVVTAAEPEVEEVMEELRVLLVMERGPAERWASSMEAAVHGVRVIPLASPDELEEVEHGAHVALVDEPHLEAFEAQQLRLSRRGFSGAACLPLEPGQLSDSEERLAAYLMMSILIGITDSRSTGCLHVQRQGGGAVGMMVFRQGRLAWASVAGSRANLLRIVAEVAGVEQEAIRDAVTRGFMETGSFHRAVVDQGLASTAQYAEALKTYLTSVVGDLLRLARPELHWSQQVRVGPLDLTFDAAEIMMSSFGT